MKEDGDIMTMQQHGEIISQMKEAWEEEKTQAVNQVDLYRGISHTIIRVYFNVLHSLFLVSMGCWVSLDRVNELYLK